MMNNTELVKNPTKSFAKYVSLNVLSMFCFSLYILADTFFVANGIGSQGIVALNLALPIYSVLNGAGLMIGIGGGTQFSIALGQKDHLTSNKVFSHSFVLAIGLGVVFTVIGAGFPEQLATLLGAHENVMELTSIYIRTVFSFSIVFILNNCLLAFIRNDGSPNLAMIAMLCGSFSNIILDYVFVFPCQMGMFGAALATGGSPVISLIILSTHFLRKKNGFRLTRCKLMLQRFGKILSNGLATFVGELSSGSVILLFNYVILDLTGDMGVAAYGIIANIALVCLSIYNGIGQGIQPIVSYNYGAGKTKNVKRTLWMALAVALGFGVLFYLSGLFFSSGIIAAFNREGSQELIQLATRGIHIYFIGFLFMGLNIACTSFFASMAHARQSFLISMLRGFILIVPLVLVLPRLWQMDGVWWTVPIAEIVTFLIAALIAKSSIRTMEQNAQFTEQEMDLS